MQPLATEARFANLNTAPALPRTSSTSPLLPPFLHPSAVLKSFLITHDERERAGVGVCCTLRGPRGCADCKCGAGTARRRISLCLVLQRAQIRHPNPQSHLRGRHPLQYYRTGAQDVLLQLWSGKGRKDHQRPTRRLEGELRICHIRESGSGRKDHQKRVRDAHLQGPQVEHRPCHSQTADVPPALFFPGGAAIPCSFQSGMPIFPLTGQDYSVLAQPGSTYQQMLLQQANGAMYLSPQPNQQAAAAAAATAAAVQYSALQSHLAAHQNAAAATFATLQHHQQYQQASLTAPLAAGGQTSQAAMMAAAAAAVAAASQWSNAANTAANGHNSSGTTSAGLPPPPQLTPAPSVSVGQHAPATLGGAVSGNCNGVLDVTQSPQVAALAAAVAAQQQLAAAAAAAAAWRWSSPSAAAAAAAASQHSSGGSGALLAPSPSALTNGSATTPTGQSVSQTASQQIHSHDLPLPPQQPHHQQQQLAFLPNTTTTSDYSTDHSAHSSGLMESVEPSIFHCDGLMSPPQQLQPTLLPTAVFAPAIFEGGIAATSSPLLTTHRHLVSPSANNNHNNTNTTITVTPTATSTNGNGSCTSNCAGQTSSQQAPQTPHLYGTPTPQPIILDVYSGAGGGIPLAPLKQTSLLSAEGLMVVEHTGGASGLKQNGGGGGGCGAGGRGGAGSSPKKLTAANGTTTNTRAAI